MSDIRWEDLDLELPTERLDRAELPEDAPVPDWVRRPLPTARDARSRAGLAEGALRSMPACVGGLRRRGLYGAYLVEVRSWVLRTLREYDVAFAPVAPGQPGVRWHTCAASPRPTVATSQSRRF